MSSEAPRTLRDGTAAVLGGPDHLGQWLNLGATLLALGGAGVLLAPSGTGVSSPGAGAVAALAALLLGTVVGSGVLAGALAVGSSSGLPVTVLLGDVLGRRSARVAAVLNLAQCVGWGVFELAVIGAGLSTVTAGAVPVRVGTAAAGVVATALALRPLGAVRLLRRVAAPAVVLAWTVACVGTVLTDGGTRDGYGATAAAASVVHVLGSGPTWSSASWAGFWPAVDVALAVAVSWVPLAADYSRHSRPAVRTWAWGAVGFALGQIACYGLGLALCLARGGSADTGALAALPVGTALLAVFVARECDLAFTNTYSAVVSVQALAPGADRVPVALVLGTVSTLWACTVGIDAFVVFLSLVGAVFTPLAGVLLATWWRRRRAGVGWGQGPGGTPAARPPAGSPPDATGHADVAVAVDLTAPADVPAPDGSSARAQDGHAQDGHALEGARPRRGAVPGAARCRTAWAAGFVCHELVSPVALPWWGDVWSTLGRACGATHLPGGACLVSLVVAAAVVLVPVRPWRGRVGPAPVRAPKDARVGDHDVVSADAGT